MAGRAGRSERVGRERRVWSRLARASLVAAILAAGATTSAAPAQAAPATLTAFYGGSVTSGTSDSVTLDAFAFASAGPTPNGVVVFSIGSTELGRATLQPASATDARATLEVDLAPSASITVTMRYLGSTEFAPATTTRTFTKSSPSTLYPRASGTITFGAVAIALDPDEPFLDRTRDRAYSPIDGSISFRSALAPASVTVDLPGRGSTVLSVAPDLSATGVVSPSGEVTMSGAATLVPRRIVDGGIDWASGCRYGSVAVELTGQMTTTDLHLTSTSSGLAPLGTGCDGRADAWDAATVGPMTMDVTIPGPFALPVVGDITTTTEVAALGGPFDQLDRITLTAAVTGQPNVPFSSSVQFAVDDVDTGYPATIVGPPGAGTATLRLAAPLEVGDHTISARYLAKPPFLPSSDSTTITVEAPPTGAATTGTIAFGPLAPQALATGAFTGAPPDDTGAMAPARFWFSLGTWTIPTSFGPAIITGRLVQAAPVGGTVDAANHVTFGPVTFRAVSSRYDVAGFTGDLEQCVHDPITATLEGTATATGMHLQVVDAALPPLPASGCAGFASQVNAQLGTTVDLSFDVAGDFRRTKVATSMTAGSFLPTVAQGNQTVLAAAIDADDDTPVGGTITFADGATVLGTVPVSGGGAVLTATMNQPGTRTITATYSGDTLHDPATTTTTVEVTPAPEGFSLDGSVDVGGIDLDIADGSVLVPQGGAPANGATAFGQAVSAPGARLWFAPTTIALKAGSYGSVTAEVRLTQNGALAPATLGPDGRFRGLVGAFALQVRKVTLANGTIVNPSGCISVVLLSIDGQVRLADAQLTSGGGGSGRYTQTTCTGVGRAVLNRLTDKTVSLSANATL